MQSVKITQYPPIWIGHITSQDVDGTKTATCTRSTSNRLTCGRFRCRTPTREVGVMPMYAVITRTDRTTLHRTAPLQPRQRRQAEMEYGYCQIGYPVLDKRLYRSSTENWWMISPNFMFASRSPPRRTSRFLGRREPVQKLLRDRYERRDLYRMAHADLCRMLLLDILQNVSKAKSRRLPTGTVTGPPTRVQLGIPHPESVRRYERRKRQLCGSALRAGHRPPLIAI